jgi:hypothetical protein
LLADWFWVAVPSIYLGFGALAVDALLEPDLRERPKWRIRAVVVIVGLAALFSWGVVFVPANLGVSAWMTDGEYPAGTNISGIAWRPEFTEVDVDIANDTDLGYEDLNIVIRPTEAIAEISQSTSVPGVSFQDANGESVHLLEKNLGSGSIQSIPACTHRNRCGL